MLSSGVPVIWKGSPAYEQARIGRLFNHRRPDRYPNGVLEATSVDDVVSGVKLARELGCRVSVRSGGHSWAAWSVRDNAILIDLGKLNFVEVNDAKTIAKVSPSTTGRLLNSSLAAHGKMFAGGHCPDVGLGGFLLQGGMGWNCANWGWACEKVCAIDVVTSEGEILHCTKDQNTDLLWAARGAGPGFPAIVTAFYLEIRDRFSEMRSSTFTWPISEYKKILAWTIKVSQESDSSVESVAVGLFPDGSREAVIMSHFVTFQNTPEAATQSLKHIDDSRPGGVIMAAPNLPTSLIKEYEDQAGANPSRHRYTCDNAYIKDDADVVEVLQDAFTTMPQGSKSFALWYSMSSSSRRQLPDMALSIQSDHYFAIYTIWQDEADDTKCQNWVKDIMSKIEHHSVGAYLGDSDFQVRRTKFWGDIQAKKLKQIRQKWDPKGTVCGYLDVGDASGSAGLENVHEWE